MKTECDNNCPIIDAKIAKLIKTQFKTLSDEKIINETANGVVTKCTSVDFSKVSDQIQFYGNLETVAKALKIDYRTFNFVAPTNVEECIDFFFELKLKLGELLPLK